MPRKPRIEYGGACFHVLNRGNYRRDLFHLPGSASAFERVLFEACQSFGWRLHGYIIMTNHFHLAVELTLPTLSVGMQWLQKTWAMRFNRFHGEKGRPFQGRFKAIHVQPGLAFANVIHYIHLNPARAGVISPHDVASFRHGSLWHFQQSSRPQFLTPTTALRGAGGLEDTPEGWAKYGEFLVRFDQADTEERRQLYAALRRGWCIGSESFKEEVRRRIVAGAPARGRAPRNITGAAWRLEREMEWGRNLESAARLFGIDLTRLPTRKSGPEKLRLALHMRATTDASNMWLAARLQMGTPNGVSALIHRYRKAEAAKSIDPVPTHPMKVE